MPKKNSYLTATDQFCGAGGTSSGVKAAGVEVKMALNHWPLAIKTHNTNHPDTDHDCTDISACDPRRYPSTNLLFTSPECTNHSQAKGKKKATNQTALFEPDLPDEAAERSRATMWDVVRFAEFHDYEIVVVENVVEVRRWVLWESWLRSMQSLGYEWKALYLNSMFFHPCPQSRDRIYIVFWKKGNTAPDLDYRPVAPCPTCGDREAYQWWKRPDKKWGKYKAQYRYRCSGCSEVVTPYYYCAMNLIDWTHPIQRIGDRKRPLAKKTIARIEHGLKKYANSQMIVTGRYTSGIANRVRNAATDVLPTQPGDTSHFLLSAIQVQRDGFGGSDKSAALPLSTQTARQDANLLLPPSIVELRGTSFSRTGTEGLSTVTAGGINHGVLLVRNNHDNKPSDLSKPIGTQANALQHGLLVGNYGGLGWQRTLDHAAGTMTTIPTQQAILTHKSWQSFMTYYYGTGGSSQVADPLRTVTGLTRSGLVTPDIRVEDCYYRCIKANEVQRAMAFADDYKVLGNSREQVKQLGNAVTPPVQKWIAQRCAESLS